jgi:hypothetical protein
LVAANTATRTAKVSITGASGSILEWPCPAEASEAAALRAAKASSKATIIASASPACRATWIQALRELRPRAVRKSSIGTARIADRMKNRPASPAPGSPADI